MCLQHTLLIHISNISLAKSELHFNTKAPEWETIRVIMSKSKREIPEQMYLNQSEKKAGQKSCKGKNDQADLHVEEGGAIPEQRDVNN